MSIHRTIDKHIDIHTVAYYSTIKWKDFLFVHALTWINPLNTQLSEKGLIQRMHTAQLCLYDILEQAHTIFFQEKISEQSFISRVVGIVIDWKWEKETVWGYGNIPILIGGLGYNRCMHYQNAIKVKICAFHCMEILYPKKITVEQSLSSINDVHGEVFRESQVSAICFKIPQK